MRNCGIVVNGRFVSLTFQEVKERIGHYVTLNICGRWIHWDSVDRRYVGR